MQSTTLRIATAGSVDDGKSTLIGRLLHDTKTVMEDQLNAVEKASRRYGDGSVNLALLTDGLRAEREQGITIDVAHRYFATPNRSFVVADTPGHAQYTRNMVTGASTSDVAIVLIDARHGMVEQTRRHALIASLLGVQEIVLAVNKMDLVGWDEVVFKQIVSDIESFLAPLATHGSQVDLTAIPISALHGDNVVERSLAAPWYGGPALLTHLEGIELRVDASVGARVHVQRVIRPQGGDAADFRGQAGVIVGGTLKVGDTVTVLPSGASSSVAGLYRWGNAVESASDGHAVVVQLADDVDVARGDVLVAGSAAHPPMVVESVDVDVCWMTDRALSIGSRWWFKHGTRVGQAVVTNIASRRDLVSAEQVPAEQLELNEMGRVSLQLSEPIVLDRYVDVRFGGRLILVDPVDNTTVGAAIVNDLALASAST